MTVETCRIDFDALPWQSPAACVRQKVFASGSRRLRLVEFAHGFVEPDWCLKGHIGYVLSGRGELTFEGRSVPFGPGDGIFIPAGLEHRHKTTVLSDVCRVILVEDV